MMAVPSYPKDICSAISFSKLVSFPTVLNDNNNVGLKSDYFETIFWKWNDLPIPGSPE